MHLRSIRRILSVLLIAMILTAGLVPSAFASVAARVNSSSAKAYKSASTKSASLNVPKNLNVTVTSISGSWAKVKYKGKSAYMPIKHLSPTNKVKGYATGTTTVYNSSGKKKGTISKGTGVYVVGTIDGYYCVTNGSGSVGFVKTGTLSEKKPETKTKKVTKKTVTKRTEKQVSNLKKSTPISKVDKAISLGKGLLGSEYSSSANPPHTFDCSTFVRYCMEKVGYSMQRTAATQAADGRYKRINDVSDLKKGDVLCFDTSGDGKVDHSAIYLGNGSFIEASRNAGKVQINTLDSWYKKHFVCARRPG